MKGIVERGIAFRDAQCSKIQKSEPTSPAPSIAVIFPVPCIPYPVPCRQPAQPLQLSHSGALRPRHPPAPLFLLRPGQVHNLCMVSKFDGP